MTFRERIGLVMIVAGLILLPAAWAFSRAVWLISFGLFGVGLWLFYTDRNARREARIEKAKGTQKTGTAVPTDIHNYTGWQQAGRSRTMDSSTETIETDAEDL